MSTSQHPVALRLERFVGGDARLLALVMMLPLIDGVFPALILAGALDDPLGAVQIGLLIFGGSATVAVILAEMTGTPREQATIVLLVGIPLILLAAVQAALAPAIGSVLDIAIFERFAALVIAAIAAKTASATIGEYLPSPAVIISLGLVASIDPNGAAFMVMDDPALVANATLAAVVGVAFALVVALGGPYLREYMDIDRFRFGSAVALGLLPLSLLGMAFGQAPLAALVVAAIFAIDVPVGFDRDSSEEDDDPDESSLGVRELGPIIDSSERDSETIFGGWVASRPETDDESDSADGSSTRGHDSTETDGRAPWL
ncbi:DUF5794 domain-containing protein [Natrarchaeobaculum sulfurireducens]|uniref:Membrane protein n=1 Tax=Natrarchaeobaculum sulfurireducens TaxID=2044521 RepID=A0A346PS23_9EURY|nr:DUF5794 domain-containing protein [Natrarchaeobaculum sulfurireducens]AXR77684.1 Membrane protein [Natrarchaeobaculum sulfurireducens]AXR82318.1 hypothetical protein AArcMg_2323 [Natrarchaeobaculum sulfurireducens]